jgi:hypothetical protein
MVALLSLLAGNIITQAAVEQSGAMQKCNIATVFIGGGLAQA